MQSKHISLVVLFIALPLLSLTQTTRFGYRVNVKEKHKVLLDVPSAKVDTVRLVPGTIVTHERQYKVGKVEYTAHYYDTITGKEEKLVFVKKKEPRQVTLPGKAYVSVDKDDRSKLILNYWSGTDSVTFLPGTVLIRSNEGKEVAEIVTAARTIAATEVSLIDYNAYIANKYSVDSAKIALASYQKKITTHPTGDTMTRIQTLNSTIARCSSRLSTLSWIEGKEIIFRLDANGNRQGVYVKKYAGDYYIKLEDREYISFGFRCSELGALSIPFKYRWSFTKRSVEIEDQFSADLSAGVFYGFSFGRIRYLYRKNEERSPQILSGTLGVLLGASKVEIDGSNTLAADSPLTTKRTIGAFSPGVGAMISIYDFRVGMFIGTDIAAGQAASKWDYSGAGWIGFGLGYNIAFFGK